MPALKRVRALGWALGVACGGAACTVVGCLQNAPTAVYTPITGIQLSASEIVAGHGCGTAPDKVYRYVAYLAYGPDSGATDAGPVGAPFVASVSDCFADKVFDLPLTGSTQNVLVTIYAFNMCSFPKALDCSTGTCLFEDGGISTLASASANWTAVCPVVGSDGVTAIADCTLQASALGPICPDGGGE